MKTYKLSKRKIERVIRDYEMITEYVELFVRSQNNSGRSGEIDIFGDRIKEHVNTSCHCHPEYEWVDRGSIQDFANWWKR